MDDAGLANVLIEARDKLERCRKRLHYWDHADTIDHAHDVADDVQLVIFKMTEVATALERRKS